MFLSYSSSITSYAPYLAGNDDDDRCSSELMKMRWTLHFPPSALFGDPSPVNLHLISGMRAAATGHSYSLLFAVGANISVLQLACHSKSGFMRSTRLSMSSQVRWFVGWQWPLKGRESVDFSRSLRTPSINTLSLSASADNVAKPRVIFL